MYHSHSDVFSFRRFISTLGVAAILTLSACASPQNEEDAAAKQDPWEGFNRGIYAFNDAFDTVILKPVAQGYRAVVPEYGRERVSNVLSNLRQPINMLNSVLQGDPGNAFSSFWSFMLNSTLGVGGIFDFADTNTDLKVREEDFGQTLGAWGVPSGPYLVLPILGPSTVRDTFGIAGDWVSDPFNYLDDEIVITRTVMRAIDARAGTLDLTDDIEKNSFDPYATYRSGYLQRREAQVRNTGHKEPLKTIK
ncbi:MAG: VacJ family lipoprotein [Rickettsiales bacterium]